MAWLIGGILFLILGYFTYGKVVERIVGPDDRPTPALAMPDGVDYVPLPKWKNMMIQLLNIAGTGPVIGVVLGIKFGKVALLIIPVGCVLMGAVHDFVCGMISVRMKGANLPTIVSRTLGKGYGRVFGWLMGFLLLLCVTVFINVPAKIIDQQWLSQLPFFWPVVGIIFGYYVLATLFPIDTIIGRIYPFFSVMLLVGTLAILGKILIDGFADPSILEESAAFVKYKTEVFNANGRSPLFPLLFVTIACGIISGFHATQSPIVARTIRSEREGRATFYGMMIAEGVIAMIWASASLVFYNHDPSQLSENAAVVLGRISTYLLGSWVGTAAVIAVVVLAITSGDTALRSARLSLSEMAGIGQAKLSSRILVCLPLIAIVVGFVWWSSLSPKTFNHIWNYFAWANQFVAVTTLMSATVWLLRQGKGAKCLVTMLPGLFMTTVVVSFILWTSADKGQPWGLVPGGLPLGLSIGIGVAVAVVLAAVAVRLGLRKDEPAE